MTLTVHRQISRCLTTLTVGLMLVIGLALPAAATGPATPAVAVSNAADDFYAPPAQLPADNGDIVRSEPSQFFLDPLLLLRAPATAHRIMYRSTDAQNQPIAVTGTVLTPHQQWVGPGERPIIGYAVGTQGLGDQCAPSRQLAAGTGGEGLFLAGLLARGYGVVVTDYEGLGTPGEHTYVQRVPQASAVLDSIRAAQRLPGADLPDSGPVLISGYSQGGGAAAAAAELAASYAPELDLIGAYAGAVPADLGAVTGQVDGSLYAAFLLYAISGLAAGEDLPIADDFNDPGQAALAAVREQCTADRIPAFAFTHSAVLTVDGSSAADLITREPYRAAVEAQRLGDDGRHPDVPVLVGHSLFDEVVPFAQAKAMAGRWCDAGSRVRFVETPVPTHVAGAAALFPASFAFLEARVAGLPHLSSCWRL